VKLLGCNWHAAPYVMLARPGIHKVADLKGKSIAASSPARRRTCGRPPSCSQDPFSDVKLAAVAAIATASRLFWRRGRCGGRVQRIHALRRSRHDVLVEARHVLPKFLRFCVLMTARR